MEKEEENPWLTAALNANGNIESYKRPNAPNYKRPDWEVREVQHNYGLLKEEAEIYASLLFEQEHTAIISFYKAIEKLKAKGNVLYGSPKDNNNNLII
ncbi:MAG: hypothetical protein HUJ68_10955 [Clostridia bacterium]|nr:hypothetical protein [Clostridia bacterium]